MNAGDTTTRTTTVNLDADAPVESLTNLATVRATGQEAPRAGRRGRLHPAPSCTSDTDPVRRRTWLLPRLRTPGPRTTDGTTVHWTYTVTNDSDVIVDGLAVSDDQSVAVTCPRTSLDPDESMACTSTGPITH